MNADTLYTLGFICCVIGGAAFSAGLLSTDEDASASPIIAGLVLIVLGLATCYTVSLRSNA